MVGCDGDVLNNDDEDDGLDGMMEEAVKRVLAEGCSRWDCIFE